jgi:hypothetical protein
MANTVATRQIRGIFNQHLNTHLDRFGPMVGWHQPLHKHSEFPLPFRGPPSPLRPSYADRYYTAQSWYYIIDFERLVIFLEENAPEQRVVTGLVGSAQTTMVVYGCVLFRVSGDATGSELFLSNFHSGILSLSVN